MEASVMYIRNQQTFDLTGHGIVTDPLGGTHCVAISGCTMKTILTGLSVNQSYTVVWREGSRSAQMPFIPAVDPAELTVKIEHNGNTIKERTYDVLHAWASQSITFTATAESADLLFTAARNEELIVDNLALGDRRMAFLSSINVLVGSQPQDQIYIRRSFENEVAYKWYMVKHLEATGEFAEETDGVEFCKAGPILEIEWGDKISQGRSGYTLAGASEDLAPALSGVKYVTNGQVEDADGNVSEAGPEVRLRLMRDGTASSLIETTTGSRYTIDGGSSGDIDPPFTIDGTTISLDVPLAKDKSADVTLTMPDPDATNPKWADYEVKPHNWTFTHEIPSSAVYEFPLPEQVTHEDGSVGNFEYVGDPWTLNGTVRIRATFAEDVDVTPFTFEPELKTYQANDLKCEVYIPEGSTKYVVDTTFNVKQDVEHKGTLKMKLGGYTRYYEWMLDQDSQIYSHPMQAENGRTPAQNGLPGTYRNQRGTFATYTFPLNLNEGQLTGRVAEEKNKVKWNGESVPKKDDSNLRELEEGETMSVEGNGMHTGYSTLTAATTAALNTDNVAGIWQRSSGEYYVVERKIASDYPLLGPGKPDETHIKAWEITVDPLSWAMNAENTEITFYNIDKATDSAGRVIGVPIPIEISLKGPTSEQTLMYSWDLGLAQQYLLTVTNEADPTGVLLKYKTDEQVENTLHMEHESFAGMSASVTSLVNAVESNLGARVEQNKIIISNLALDVSNGVPSEVALTVNLTELVAIENGDFSQGPATDGHLTLDEDNPLPGWTIQTQVVRIRSGASGANGWVGSAAPVVDDQPLFEYLVNLHGSDPTTKSLSTTVRDLVPGNTYELSWWERKRNGAGYGIPYQDREVGVFIGDEAICEFAIIPSLAWARRTCSFKAAGNEATITFKTRSPDGVDAIDGSAFLANVSITDQQPTTFQYFIPAIQIEEAAPATSDYLVLSGKLFDTTLHVTSDVMASHDQVWLVHRYAEEAVDRKTTLVFGNFPARLIFTSKGDFQLFNATDNGGAILSEPVTHSSGENNAVTFAVRMYENNIEVSWLSTVSQTINSRTAGWPGQLTNETYAGKFGNTNNKIGGVSREELADPYGGHNIHVTNGFGWWFSAQETGYQFSENEVQTMLQNVWDSNGASYT